MVMRGHASHHPMTDYLPEARPVVQNIKIYKVFSFILGILKSTQGQIYTIRVKNIHTPHIDY